MGEHKRRKEKQVDHDPKLKIADEIKDDVHDQVEKAVERAEAAAVPALPDKKLADCTWEDITQWISGKFPVIGVTGILIEAGAHKIVYLNGVGTPDTMFTLHSMLDCHTKMVGQQALQIGRPPTGPQLAVPDKRLVVPG